MKWDNFIFIDTCLPYGLHSAPNLFNILADLLQWITQQHGICHIMHYLDDFLLLVPLGLNECQTNLNIIVKCCKALGVPLALEKLECPSTSISFLGIVIDTVHMQLCLPQDKLQRITDLITTWLSKNLLPREKYYHLRGCSSMQLKLYAAGDLVLVACMQQQPK